MMPIGSMVPSRLKLTMLTAMCEIACKSVIMGVAKWSEDGYGLDRPAAKDLT